MEQPPVVRSRARDVASNVVMTVLALVFGLVVAGSLFPGIARKPMALNVMDAGLAVLGFALLWWRRRFPLYFAAYVLVASTFTTLISGLAMVAVFTVAEYRRAPEAVGLSVLFSLAAWPNLALYGSPDTPKAPWIVVTLVLTLSFTGWGMYLRARRQLLATLVERLDRADEERVEAVDRARAAERRRIARDMHDVLSYRFAVLGIHAGALEMRPDARPEEIATSARVIRETVHDGLDELRTAIRALREEPEDPARAPAPRLRDVAGLIDRVRHAGGDVSFSADGVDLDRAGSQCGIAAYRIVQEGLTNAGKHAPGAPVRVALAVSDDLHLSILVENERAPRQEEPPSGGGVGLLGLSERAAALHGRLEYGSAPGGGFRVCAELPLTSEATDEQRS
ncbi:histidine kinase [Propionimicrobium sp. PCR01-08-3]|uniref:sensor histidine kinase n=1 Tax=Propionimicrobium sp. PCR01-08-3 TaxID=3052086 RepID=UPI00255CFFB6|nr:histidine kinase [Propionimicrobium sp. PCR01-08-3]WIY83542.1 histidine kinase [Propionimicrobium sp. PCR01-08-3]